MCCFLVLADVMCLCLLFVCYVCCLCIYVVCFCSGFVHVMVVGFLFVYWFVMFACFMIIRLFVFGCFVVYPLFFRLFKVVVVCVPIVCLFCVNVLLLMIVVFLCAC